MSLKSIYKKAPISDRNAVLTFGKYKGESIADILETDAQYLVWLHDNNDFFELDHILLDEAEQGGRAQRREFDEFIAIDMWDVVHNHD